jgi:hypothetical protein
MAGASFAPSPVIATTLPIRWYAWMIRTFCVGLQRATTSTFGSTSASRSSESDAMSSPVSTVRSPSLRWTCPATASPVAGWSPVIITICTPASRSCAAAGGALSRTGSASATKPSRHRSVTSSSSTATSLSTSDISRSATASTRCPDPARSAMRRSSRERVAASTGRAVPLARWFVQRGMTVSGAPFTLRYARRPERPTVAW